MESLIVIFFILFIVFKILFLPNIKGAIGESIVSRKLHSLAQDNCIVVDDIIIKGKNGSSQIDHVVICPFGIFVIETKFYKGWIFGNEYSHNWTQVIYRKKFKVFNPIKQNEGHIKALKYILPKYSHVPFYSIVVLAGSCIFKSFDEVETSVIYPSDISETINSFEGATLLTQNDMVNIENILINFSNNDKEIINEHIANVRHAKYAYNYSIESGKCPKCGGEIVVRHGKYGEFFGCSNYPRCKFTKGF